MCSNRHREQCRRCREKRLGVYMSSRGRNDSTVHQQSSQLCPAHHMRRSHCHVCAVYSSAETACIALFMGRRCRSHHHSSCPPKYPNLESDGSKATTMESEVRLRHDPIRHLLFHGLSKHSTPVGRRCDISNGVVATQCIVRHVGDWELHEHKLR